MAVVILAAATAGIAAWVTNGAAINHWIAIHTGVVDEAGPYYAFWSGFGSDLAELSLVGAVVTGVYQLARKWNCHQPGCLRLGTHQAAGGTFNLCYRHHPDFQGSKPSAQLIAALHADIRAMPLPRHTAKVPPDRQVETTDP